MRLLVFDLDGTLLDSLPDLTAALNRTLATRGIAPFAPGEVAPLVGDGAGVLLRQACALRGVAADEALVAAYLADYSAHPAEQTRPFPGVVEMLRDVQAQGCRLAICTNKPTLPARAVLSALGLAGMFAAIGGGDTFPDRKPHPGHLLGTIQAARGVPSESVMVGDHRNDVEAALGAGVPCIFAAWGYGTAGMAEGAAAIAETVAELPDLAARLRPA